MDFNGLGNNGGYAVVLPDNTPSPWEVYNTLQQQNLQRQMLEDRRRQEALAHADMLNQYVGQVLDDKAFANIPPEELATLQNKYVDMLNSRKGPDGKPLNLRRMSTADLRQLMRSDILNVANRNDAIGKGKKYVDAQVDALKPFNKNINVEGVRQLAYDDLLFQRDKDGNKIGYRSPEEIRQIIDSQKNLVDPAINTGLQKFPGAVLTNTLDMDEWLKSLVPAEEGFTKKRTNSHGGFDSEMWKASFYPGFQQTEDDGDGGKRVVTQSEILKGPDGKELQEPVLGPDKKPLIKNGRPVMQPVKIASQSAYDTFTSSYPGKVTLNKMYLDHKRDLESQGVKLPDDLDSPEAVAIKKKLLYDLYESRAPKSVILNNIVKDNPAPQTHSTTTVIMGGDQKPQRISDWNILASTLASGGYDHLAQKVVDRTSGKETGELNILPAIGGAGKLRVVTPDGNNRVASRIIYDPKKRDSYKVYFLTKDGSKEVNAPIVVNKKELKDWMYKTAGANKDSRSFVSDDVDVNFDASGNPLATPMDRKANTQPKTRTTTSVTRR